MPRYQHPLPLLLISSVFVLGISSAALAGETPSSFRSISEAQTQQLGKLHQRAEEYILTNNFKAAIRMYDEIVLLEPDDETAYTGLGQCYLVLGDFDRAKNAYLNALHINPNNEVAYLGLQKIEDPDTLTRTEEIREPVKPAEPNPQETPILSREEIIQTALKNAGLYTGPIDGRIGPATRKAVSDFQARHEIKVDGKVGPQTMALLQPYLHPESFDQSRRQESADKKFSA